MESTRSLRTRAPWLVLAGIAAVFAPVSRAADEVGNAQVKRGFEIVPPGVYLNLDGKSRAMVGLGSYIVNTTGCVDCHTHPSYLPNGDPFRGFPEMINYAQYMTGGRQFGPFTAPNLTPDASGKPAGLTLQQFITTLRTGHNPNDPAGEILQACPGRPSARRPIST